MHPRCPVCDLPVDRLRKSFGIVAAYPCNHWLTPAQANDVRKQAHAAAQEAAREREPADA